MAKANIDRFYPGLIDEATLGRFLDTHYAIPLDERGIPDQLNRTVYSIDTSEADTSTIMLTDFLGISELLRGTINAASYRIRSAGYGDPEENKDLIDNLHKKSRHGDAEPKDRSALKESERYRTIIIAITGELSVKLYNSHRRLSKSNAEIHMHPGDVLVFDYDHQHSVVPIGDDARLSYSIAHTIDLEKAVA